VTYLHATKTLSHVVTEKFLDSYCKFSGVLLVPNPTSSRASTITPMPLMMNLISVPVKHREIEPAAPPGIFIWGLFPRRSIGYVSPPVGSRGEAPVGSLGGLQSRS